MRISREQAAGNRERVVDAASRLLRARGLDGVGVDAVMAEAGLTHGGFYKSFGSRDALVAEACGRAVDRMAAYRAARAARARDPLADLVGRYLSPAHRDAPADGCPFAALAAEAARRDGPVRTVFTAGLAAFATDIMQLLPGRIAARRRRKALAAAATMIGALTMARAVEDPAFADEILAAARTAILGEDGGAGRRDDPDPHRGRPS